MNIAHNANKENLEFFIPTLYLLKRQKQCKWRRNWFASLSERKRNQVSSSRMHPAIQSQQSTQVFSPLTAGWMFHIAGIEYASEYACVCVCVRVRPRASQQNITYYEIWKSYSDTESRTTKSDPKQSRLSLFICTAASKNLRNLYTSIELLLNCFRTTHRQNTHRGVTVRRYVHQRLSCSPKLHNCWDRMSKVFVFFLVGLVVLMKPTQNQLTIFIWYVCGRRRGTHAYTNKVWHVSMSSVSTFKTGGFCWSIKILPLE